MAEPTGADALLEVLRTEGVKHVFGNPGSTELPFIDALASAPDLEYVLALQEATAVGMADGYAQATRRPAFLNLHTAAGLGNAIGNLTNAGANHTPLVVTAGQQDTRHLITDPLLSGDLTGIAGPVAKWAHEVRTGSELGTVLRRAFRDAANAPQGPVFVSIPLDLLDGPAPEPPPRSTVRRDAVAGGLEELADLLASTPSGRLGLVVADEVTHSDANDAVVALAEALGAPVHGAPLFGTAVFPPAHPLWAGMLAPTATAIRDTLVQYDRVLHVGGQAFLVYHHSDGPSLPASVELLHLSPDPGELGRAWPVRLGVAGDVAASVAALVPLVRARIDATAAATALAAAGARHRAELDRLEELARSRYAQSPVDPMAAAHAVVRALPPGTPLVDEAPTTGFYARGFHHDGGPNGYFFCRGGGLGWGMPAALGVSLGRGREPVLCLVGDGSAMYSPQALWTAAHEQLPVVFAVVNNRQYRILKDVLRRGGSSAAAAGNFVALDLDEPPVDYLALAGSMGVAATLVEKADDVGDAVRAALATGVPHLIEIPIAAP